MGKAMSYGELDLKSRAFASYLQNVARLPSGARVALMMPNVLQYPIAAFGALRAGYVVVNCNPLYSPRELKHQLADSGAEAIVVLENFAGTLEKAIGRGGAKTSSSLPPATNWAPPKGASSMRSCATCGAPFPPFACRRACISFARWPSDRGSRSSTPPFSRTISPSFSTLGGPPGCRRGRC